MNIKYLNNVPKISHKSRGHYENVNALESFMMSDYPTMKVIVKIGEDYDCDYKTLSSARSSWIASMKRCDADKSIILTVDSYENALYFIKKVSVPDACR